MLFWQSRTSVTGRNGGAGVPTQASVAEQRQLMSIDLAGVLPPTSGA